MNKKGVSDVVATILIILLVLAAVIIVWQVVSKVVKGGATSVEERSKCIAVSLDFVTGSVKCNNATGSYLVSGSISRSGDNVDGLKMKVVVGSKVNDTIKAPDSLGTVPVSGLNDAPALALNSQVLVKVAPVIPGSNGDITCDPTSETTITCVPA